jgi:ParB-like chromosome segregation protein Spo0J
MVRMINWVKGVLRGNDGGEKVRFVKTKSIKTDPRIAGIFRIDTNTLNMIVHSMKKNGFDIAEPIVVWKDHDVVVDGHTRLKASIEAGIEEVPVIEKDFTDFDEVVRYTYKRQAERRNLTQAEILQAAMTLSIKETHDGSGRSSEKLAKDLGVSESTIVRARTVAKKGTENDINAIKNGTKSINQAYQNVRIKKDDNSSLEKTEHSDSKETKTLEKEENRIKEENQKDGENISNHLDLPAMDNFTNKSAVTANEPRDHANKMISGNSIVGFFEEAIIFLIEKKELNAGKLILDKYRCLFGEETFLAMNDRLQAVKNE